MEACSHLYAITLYTFYACSSGNERADKKAETQLGVTVAICFYVPSAFVFVALLFSIIYRHITWAFVSPHSTTSTTLPYATHVLLLLLPAAAHVLA